MSNEKKTWRQTAGILLSVCALGMACCSLFLCFSSDIWYDELFTVGFVSQPVGRMISLAARDVHPPLYYLMVKAAVELVHLFAPGADAVIICKVVSVLPYLALLGYSLTLIRKKYGWLCSGLFSFCILAMPQMANYTTEIRMYGFALFFITAAFLHAGELLEGGGKGIGPPSLFMGSQRPIPIILRRLRRRRCMWAWLCFCPLRRRKNG